MILKRKQHSFFTSGGVLRTQFTTVLKLVNKELSLYSASDTKVNLANINEENRI